MLKITRGGVYQRALPCEIASSPEAPRNDRRKQHDFVLFDVLDWILAITTHIPNKGEQLVRIPQPAADLVQPDDDLFQPRPFLAECLGALRFVPDVRLFQFPLDLCQPLCLLIVVKDTSSTHRRVQ